MGAVARRVSRYITWIEVSVGEVERQGYALMWGDCESITGMKGSVKHVERTCEEISVFNVWGV